MKTGHCLTGQYLQWTKNQPTARCWWCRCQTQRDHLSKGCPEWKAQQKILWAEVLKATWVGGRAGGRSGAFLPMGDAARRYQTSSPLRM